MSTPITSAGSPSVSDDGPPPRLSALSFWGCMALLLAIFIGLNPVWEPIDMEAMDQNIWWSYVPIPLLVVACLAWEKKLTRAAFFLETLKMTLVKFGITYVVANTAWLVVGAPPVPEDAGLEPAPANAARYFDERAAPAASALDPHATGVVTGVVVDADAAPVAGVWVAVIAGLDAYTFEPPTEPMHFTHDGDGFTPATAFVQTFRPVVLTTTDGDLHVARALDDAGRRMFNYAVPAGGDRRLMFQRAYGAVTLGCRAHEDEGVAQLLVLDHPYAALTDAAGAFRLEGVPAGTFTVAAMAPGDGPDAAGAAVDVELEAGGQVALTVPAP